MMVDGNIKLQISVVRSGAKTGAKYLALVAGEVVGNGTTKSEAMADAVTRMYRGYALHYFGTETPVKSWWSNPENNKAARPEVANA